jgi:hypothetical protein
VFKEVLDNPLANVMAIFAGVHRVEPINIPSEGCKVKGNKHGIRNGWFNHPFNFDPTWLEECSGFKNKKEK